MSRKIFISYSHWNEHFAQRLYCDLERAGFGPWLDSQSIPLGEMWEHEIAEGIKSSSHIILLASPHAAKSEYIRRELAIASDLHIPVLIIQAGGKDTELPSDWLSRQCANGTGGHYWSALRKLLNALKYKGPELRHLVAVHACSLAARMA